jgi:hypothetical protein
MASMYDFGGVLYFLLLTILALFCTSKISIDSYLWRSISHRPQAYYVGTTISLLVCLTLSSSLLLCLSLSLGRWLAWGSGFVWLCCAFAPECQPLGPLGPWPGHQRWPRAAGMRPGGRCDVSREKIRACSQLHSRIKDTGVLSSGTDLWPPPLGHRHSHNLCIFRHAERNGNEMEMTYLPSLNMCLCINSNRESMLCQLHWADRLQSKPLRWPTSAHSPLSLIVMLELASCISVVNSHRRPLKWWQPGYSGGRGEAQK